MDNTHKDVVKKAYTYVSEIMRIRDNRNIIDNAESAIQDNLDELFCMLEETLTPFNDMEDSGCGHDSETGALVYHQSEYERLYLEERRRAEKAEDNVRFWKDHCEKGAKETEFLAKQIAHMTEYMGGNSLVNYFIDMAYTAVRNK